MEKSSADVRSSTYFLITLFIIQDDASYGVHHSAAKDEIDLKRQV